MRPLWYLPRVSVRALMILVLLVGGGFGWTVHQCTARIQREAVAAIEQAGGYVFYDCDRDPKRIVTVRTPAYNKWRPRGQNMPGLKRLPGLESTTSTTSSRLCWAAFSRTTNSFWSDVVPGSRRSGTPVSRWVTDAGLAHLDGLAALKELDLCQQPHYRSWTCPLERNEEP